MGKIQRAISLLGIVAMTACAQTRLQTPVIIQRKSTPTVAPGTLVFPNSANIDCVAANYATCRPSTITNNNASGDLVLQNQVAGANSRLFLGANGSVAGSDQFALWRTGGVKRAELLPGGALGSGRLHLGNTAGTFYTGFIADPAMTTSPIYQLPLADGTAGDCLSTDGATVLSWVSCSGGGSTPPFVDTTNIIKGSGDATKLLKFEVDGFTTATTRTLTPQNASYTIAGIDLAQTWTATQTMRDVKPSVDDTYKLGEDATPLRWYELNANRINGICTTVFTCSQTNNYINTRKINLYDMSGSIGGGSWDMRTNANSPIMSYLEVRDQAGVAFLTLNRQAASVTVNNGVIDGNWLPSTDLAYDAGTSTNRWKILEGQQFFARTGGAGAASSTAYCQFTGGGYNCTNASATTFSATRLTGQILSAALAGAGVKCLESDNSGNINLSSGGCSTDPTSSTGDMIYRNSGGSLTRLAIGSTNDCLIVTGGIPAWSATCVKTSRNINTSSPLGGGGALSADLTLTCSTCVTTAGGQSISGTTTLSTASISTAISGTFSMSGTETVSGSLTIKSSATAGNFYNRVVSDPSVALSCSPGGTPITDGWTAIVHDGSGGAPYWVVCDNTGTRYKVALTAY